MISEFDIPNIRDYIEIYENENDIIFHSYQSSITKYFDNSEEFKELFKVVNGKDSINEIYLKINKKYPHVELTEVLETIIDMYEEGILDIKKEKNQFKKLDYGERWNKQIAFFEEYNINRNKNNFHEKLSNSTVTIIGLGGTGSWVAQSLAMSNIGKLILIDNDTIEVSNLNRQPMFRYKDISKTKVDVSKEFIHKINQDVEVEVVCQEITKKEQLIYYAMKSDLVISCADKPSTSEMGILVTEVCYPLNKAHIIGGGYNSHSGALGTSIIPGKTGCFNCYINSVNERRKNDEKNWKIIHYANKKREIGSLAAVSGFVGNIICLEAVKILTDFADPWLSNKFIEFHFGKNQLIESFFDAHKLCQICGEVI